MAKKMEHIPVAYPTAEQGLHSAQHVISHALGREVLPMSQLAAHGWVAAGAGLGVALPPDGPVSSAAVTLTAAEKSQLQEFADLQASEGMKLDPEKWKALAKIVLGILLKLLVAVVIVVGLTRSAAAAEQAPRPPQAPPAFEASPSPRASASRTPAAEAAPHCKKTCPCSDACVCGCVVGKPCICRTLRPSVLPSAPATEPAFRFAPAPAMQFRPFFGGGMRGGLSRGGGGGGC